MHSNMEIKVATKQELFYYFLKNNALCTHCTTDHGFKIVQQKMINCIQNFRTPVSVILAFLHSQLMQTMLHLRKIRVLDQNV